MAGIWRLTAVLALAAACAAQVHAATAPAYTAPARAASVPGLEVVSAVSGGGSGTPKSARAVCPEGKQVVGTGGSVGGFLPGLLVTGIVPAGDLSSVTVTGAEDEHGTEAEWSVRAYAVCAAPLPDAVLVSGALAADRRPVKGVAVNCPPGTRAIGAGGAIEGAEGEVLLNHLGVRPSSRKHPERATIAAAVDGTGAGDAWGLRVYGICAAPPPGLGVVQQQTAPGSPPTQPLVGPPCPAGQRVLGPGGHVVFEERQVALRHLIPNERSVSVVALEDRDGTPGVWVLDAHAVCADG